MPSVIINQVGINYVKHWEKGIDLSEAELHSTYLLGVKTPKPINEYLPENTTVGKVKITLTIDGFFKMYGSTVGIGRELIQTSPSFQSYIIQEEIRVQSSINGKKIIIGVDSGEFIEKWDNFHLSYFNLSQEGWWRNPTPVTGTIEVEYTFNPPSNPTSLSPNKEAINPRKPIRFGWDNKYPQSKFELQYRVGTSAWKSITQNTAFKYYEMPYGTIAEKEGTLQWRLRTAGENGVFSDWENATCELAVETQKEPNIIRPSGDYIESSRPVRFEWQFISNTSEEQVSFEIEYTLDKNTPVQKITETTSEQFYTLEHDHNSSTIAKWRIRVTNNYEEVSEWTDWAEFNIMGAPPIPQILEVSNTNIPTMKWNSKEQEVFEIFIFDKDDNKIYETGKIIGEEIRAYKLNTTLINGKYKFALIVYNKYDVASPQAEFTIIINPEPIEIPEISVHENDYYIYIRSSIENGQVFRNNHHIGDLINGEFYDYTGANNKLYNYKVRNIVNGVTADSESKSASVNFIYSTLALLSKPDEFIKLDMSLDKLPEQSVNINYDNAQFQLDGRKYPVTEFSGRVAETISIEYFVWQIDEMRKLLDAKEEMIYRDDSGYVFIGVSTGLGYNNLFFGKNTSFTMTKSRDEYD